MASQLTTEKVISHTVEPKYFAIEGGEWIMPSEDHRDAVLIVATAFEVTATVDINPLINNNVIVTFDLCKTTDSNSSWDFADIYIGARVGAYGKYAYRAVNSQLADMIPGEPKLVSAEFSLNPANAPDRKLHFGVFHTEDVKPLPKRGMRFSDATVQITEKI